MPTSHGRLQLAGVAILALAASITGLGNGFALDDIPIVLTNQRIHSLSAPWTFLGQTYWPADQGPALYRPLTIFGFALQWGASAGAPVVFHLTSILLYVAAALAVFWLALELLPRPVALVAAALFAVHPVHVEAVANVVGQSELLVGILVPVAVAWYVHARRRGPITTRGGIVLAALYALSLGAKEHAVVLPGLLICAELLLVNDTTPVRARLERALPALLGLVAVLITFWTVRTMVTGGTIGRDIHPAFRNGDVGTRLLTALGVVPEWLRLLLYPVHLSADYNPQEIPILTSFGWRAFLGLSLLLELAWAVVWAWRRRPIVAFGILWTGLTIFPVSNFLLPTGILLAERTLFLPSVGVVLIVGGLLAPLWPAIQTWPVVRQRLAGGLVALILLGGLVRSALRQPVWKDNATLFRVTAQDAPRSYKARAAYGVMLLQSGQEEAGEREYLEGLSLYRDDPNLFADLGDWYLRKNRCEDALAAYARVLELVPNHWAATSRTILCLTRVGRLDEARRLAEVAVGRGDEGAPAKLAYVDSLIAHRAGPEAQAGKPSPGTPGAAPRP